MSPVLDAVQKQALHDDGYVLLAGAVPRRAVDEALRAINMSLGTEGLSKDALPGYRSRTFTPELVATPAIRALWTGSDLPALVESAWGTGNVRTPSEGQVALRFPTPAPGSPAVPHIDGVSSPDNGVKAGTLWHFTGLAGVFLSDVTEADRGNLTVWPGSHHALEAHVRAHGVASVSERFPAIPLAPPRPIIARAGDAIFAHYMLAHGIAPNLGPHVRYAAFFRLFHTHHDPNDMKPLGAIWTHWAGMPARRG